MSNRSGRSQNRSLHRSESPQLPEQLPMQPVVLNIDQLTVANLVFRRVIATTYQMQLVLMTLLPGEDIGMEVHPYVTQFIRIEQGDGVAILNGRRYPLMNGSAVLIPAGTWHNIINTGTNPLHLYTIYAPPNHPPNRYDISKPEATSETDQV
jgi:mannose-6-phosphate isomerase-like protein (cupin superfamily)